MLIVLTIMAGVEKVTITGETDSRNGYLVLKWRASSCCKDHCL